MHYLSLLALLLSLILAVESFSPLSPSSSVEIWPFANDGIVNPPAYYQRYRRDEYPADKPFFQWWYYCFSDFTNDQYFLVAFGIDQTHTETGDKYFTVAFGGVDAKKGLSWHKGEKFDISVANITNYFDVKATDPVTGEIMYHLSVQDDDTYHLVGSMSRPDNTFDNVNIDKDTIVSFNLTLNRINGWYGQQDLEKWQIEFAKGEISWNPYAHNSLIEGEVTVGNVSYPFSHSPQYRGYGDMNWGERFPAGDTVSDGPDFPWGWFTVNVPNEDPTMDFSIVVGIGKAEYGVPLGRISASFADFHFNNTHLGIRHILGWDGDEFTLPILVTSSDGSLFSFNSTKSNYATFVEGKYNFSLPLCQTLSFSTTSYNIFLNFTTTTDLINRLVFAYDDVFFSDFEALGAQVHVVIDHKDEKGNINNIYDFVKGGAGYEFGYETQEGFSS